MTDRLDALERLQRLRESGAITDAEFEREKQALFSQAAAPPIGYPPDPYAPAAPLPARSGTPAWVWLLVGLAAVALISALIWLLLGSNQQRSEETSDTNRVEARPRPEANAQAEANAQPSIRARPPAEQRAAAFRAAFGSRTTRRVDDYDITYRPGFLTWAGERAILVSEGRNAEDCHVCAGMVAVHYLAPDGDGFRIVGEHLRVATDDYGEPPDWRVTSAFTDAPVLQAESGGGNQGIFCGRVQLFDLSGEAPREMATIPVGFTNEGAEGEEAGLQIDGVIANVQRGRSFDVAYTGDERFTETWQLRGGRFELASGQTRMRTCG